MSDARKLAAKQMLAIPLPERIQLLLETEHENLLEAEQAKDHPFKTLQFTEGEFAAICDHALDGGGVIDRGRIARLLAADLLARKQGPDFMGNLMHYFKACLKTDGHVQPHVVPEDAGDGVAPPVTVNGVLPAGVDPQEIHERLKAGRILKKET